MVIKLDRSGEGLVLHLPAEVAAGAGLSEGQDVHLVARSGEVVVCSDKPLTIEEMFRGRSSEEWRALYKGHFDWGPDVGREIIDD